MAFEIDLEVFQIVCAHLHHSIKALNLTCQKSVHLSCESNKILLFYLQ
jgi:hypothetical protein